METFEYKNHKFEKAGTFRTYGITNIWDHRQYSQHMTCECVLEINYDDFYKNGNKDTDAFKMDGKILCVPVCSRLIKFSAKPMNNK